MKQLGVLNGLAPLIGARPRILLLGSMPSVVSLDKQQYYAHPRNVFWSLLARLLSFKLHAEYANNVAKVTQNGIAIWDVIGQCERLGSLDSAIVKGSEKINPVADLIEKHPSIRAIGLNGGAAAGLFKRHCLPRFDADNVAIHYLPSTSPANARMNFEQKCAAWEPLFKVDA